MPIINMSRNNGSGAFITAEDLHTIEKTSLVQADSNTLNTPYKDSLTSATNGTCVVSVTENNKTLFYICNGATNPVYIQLCINGVWNSWKTLIDDSYVTIDELEAYVPKTEKGAANGVAELDGSGKVPSDQLPDMNYVPTSEKGVANGVATLDSTGRLPESQLPLSVEQIQGVSDDIAALKLNIEQWWDYLVWRYGVETVIEGGDGSTYAKKFTETVKNGGETVATCVCTKAMTGTQFVSVYTIGETTRTHTTTINGDGTFTEVWS